MIPETVRIGPYDIRVQYVKNLMTDDDQCGNWNPRTLAISLDPDMDPALKTGAFYHELIEAVKDIYHVDCLQKDHHAINLLGEALHQLMRDNGKEILS